MQIVSLNTGEIQPLEVGAKLVPSGIVKRPRSGPVKLSIQGVEGDHIANLEAHGGPDQAVYLYRQEDYSWWSQELGTPLEWGRLGENLTVSGLPSELRVGDILRFGEVCLQLSAPRIPCSKLAARLGRADFVKTFAAARRPGAYARVLSGGWLETGLSGSLERYAGVQVDVAEVLDLWYTKSPDLALLSRARRSPLAGRARQALDRLHGPADYLALSYQADGREELRRVYGGWAQSYDRDLEKLQWDKPARVVDLVEQLGCPRGRALDVGCGTGWVGSALQKRGWTQIEAADFSPAMLEQARARGCYTRLWERDVAQPLALEDFDLVTAVGLLTQGHAPAGALEHLLACCRTGGWLAFSLRDDLLTALGYAEIIEDWQQRNAARCLARRTLDEGLGGHPWSIWIFERNP